MKTFNTIALIAIAGLQLPATGQVSFGGSPIGIRAEKLGLPRAETHVMPAVDTDALLAEDATREASGFKEPWRFGYNHSVHLGTDNAGTWDVLPNGDRLWRLSVECPGALSINFVFDAYVVPEGGMVFVYNEAGEVLGGFTAESNPGHSELGVTQLAGERITIEYQEPADMSGEGYLHIDQVTHGYRDVLGLVKGLGDSGSCNNNVECPVSAGWEDQIRSVAMITVGGSGICTGQLINNCSNDGTPYFLTANHCLGGGVGSWVFRFNWQSPQCTPTTNGPTNQTISGAQLLANSSGSDVALLQLNATPPANYNVFYTGWDRSGSTPSSAVAIHHPSGDVKKISFENNSLQQANWGGAQCWHVTAWDDGTTEGGSSGSGLWDQNKRLVGQLYGGQASCSFNVNDYYGRFNVSWPLLQPHLGNCGNTLDGYDPNFNPLDLDASIESIVGVPDELCDENTITPQITIRNLGNLTLTSLTINYDVNGQNPGSFTWSGSLISGASTSASLPVLTLGNGLQVLSVSCSSPNGQTDQNPANDTRTKNVQVASPGEVITVSITLDDYGSETTWELADQQGNVLATGGPYANNQNGTVVTEDLCVASGCYEFTIFDSVGDGICCDYGLGSYEILDDQGTVLGSGNGVFDFQDMITVCAISNSVLEHSEIPFTLWPNPANDRLELVLERLFQGQVELELVDPVGRTVVRRILNGSAQRTVIDVSGLADGFYLLSVASDGIRTTKRLVVRH
ncbi:MAG: trypsin-like peptidase domain-containing protein [Flavobacteriales bacterium]|nr:trypsin-like peptidase domain-containing protein [Flavobacteriales bacterium]